jgi:hypothetical protein
MTRLTEVQIARVAKMEARLEHELVEAQKRLSKGSPWPDVKAALVAAFERALSKIRDDRAG